MIVTSVKIGFVIVSNRICRQNRKLFIDFSPDLHVPLATFEDLFGKRNEIRFQGIVISLPVKGKIKSAADLPNVYAFQFHFKGTWTGGIRLDRSTFIVQRPFNRVQMIWSFFSGICRKINRLFVNKIKFFRILYNVKIRVKIRVELFE